MPKHILASPFVVKFSKNKSFITCIHSLLAVFTNNEWNQLHNSNFNYLLNVQNRSIVSLTIAMRKHNTKIKIKTILNEFINLLEYYIGKSTTPPAVIKNSATSFGVSGEYTISNRRTVNKSPLIFISFGIFESWRRVRPKCAHDKPKQGVSFAASLTVAT